MADNDSAVVDESAEQDEPQKTKLQLDVNIANAGPCRKHVRVRVARESLKEIEDGVLERYRSEAEVPGFRPGNVPAALIRRRFKKELSEQLKSKVLVASLGQIAEDYDLDPINEPNLDLDAFDIPDDGDFEFEFDVEVRPEFKLPTYKGLKIDRPVYAVNEESVDAFLGRFLEQYGQLAPIDEPAREGDFVVAHIEFRHNGELLKRLEERSVRLKATLNFTDGELPGLSALLAGARPGDTRAGEAIVSLEAPNVAMRGEKVALTFEVLDVKRMIVPALDDEFLRRVSASSAEDLRQRLRTTLDRQIVYSQRQSCRKQVLSQITESASWELPEELVAQQVENAMRREVLEMQQAGFTTAEILARENDLRQRSISTTRRNLKEHFVLDQIAETEDIQVNDADLMLEIEVMAMQSGENPRRVRAKMIKSGLIENLAAQVRERKAVDVILNHAEFRDVSQPLEVVSDEFAIDDSICIEATTLDSDEGDDEDDE